MYNTRPNLILAFHGCDRKLRDRLVLSPSELRPSTELFDWLGSGMYFWESDPTRAMRWAEDLKKNPRHADQKVQTPAVLGAVISLNNCLDLLDVRSIELVKRAYTDYLKTSKLAGVTIPQNIGGVEQKARYLDCAVINSLHQRIEEGEVPFDNLTTFDSVRAMFPEGEPLYPNAGFRKQNHIQICIRNADCVKGLFVPRKSHGMIV